VCYVAARVEEGESRSSGDLCATVPMVLFTSRMRQLGQRGREEAGRGPCPRPSKREGILLNSCLIRLIHLLFLYREDFLTYKQSLLDL
jgi:hypothetical protein